MYEVMFFDMQKYIYILKVYSIQYWDKTQTLKNFSSHKINGSKSAPAHHSFTFNLQFLGSSL